MNKMFGFIVSIFFILNGSVLLSEGSEPKMDKIVLDLPGEEINLVLNADGFADFTGSHIQWLQQTGEPSLPWRVITVLLPPQVQFKTVATRLQRAHYRAVDGIWQLKPMPPELTWHDGRKVINWPNDRTIVNGYDRHIYDNDKLWPAAGARLLKTGRLRKFRLVTIVYVYPLFRFRECRNQRLCDQRQFSNHSRWRHHLELC